MLAFVPKLFAAADDPPLTFTPKEKAEWNQATCKWRVAKSPEYAGYSEMVIGRKECFALGRYNFIFIDHNADIPEESRKIFRDDILIIYDDHNGHKELCHLIPVKRPYDKFSLEKVTSAIAAGAAEFDQLIEKLDANINLQCLMM